MNRSAACLFVIVMMVFSSCSFHRLVAGKKAKSYDRPADSTGMAISSAYALFPQPDTIANSPDTANAMRTLIVEIAPVYNKRLSYTTFSGKARVHFDGPDEKQEFTAHIRIRKDSVIWVNITALGGILFAKLLVTPDSFFMVNIQKGEAICLPLSAAAKILPGKVDFASLQNLIVGEPLRNGSITTASTFGGSWTIGIEDSAYVQRLTYNKADSTLRTGQMRTRLPNGPQAMTEYGSYMVTEGRRVSSARVINIQNGNDVYSIDMNFTKISLDEALDFPFSIPKSYTINPANQ